MKTHTLIIFLIITFPIRGLAQDIYAVNFMAIDTNQVALKNYAGKKIIIYAFDAAAPDTTQLKSFDSLYHSANNRIIVIGIPLNDFSSPMTSTALLSLLKDSIHIDYPVAMISKGKKGIGQHPLMQWVTTNSKKNHYNIDLSEAGEIFIVSSKGILYSIFRNGLNVSNNFIKSALNNDPNQ